MGVLHKGKEKLENLKRRTRMKRSEQKKRQPKKSGKNKPSLKLTIPSRRGRRKKWFHSISLTKKAIWALREVKVKELVELIAKSLVDNPENVQVSQIDGQQTSILELKVAQEDMGKIIGKQGRTAHAIRVILGAAGMKLKKRFNLEIID
jgi:predicted RNA-binding protein YlqC (UPF0109 family)